MANTNYDIYICASHRCKEREVLANLLSKNGLTYTEDRMMPGGSTWQDVVGINIRNVKLVVLLVDKLFLDSPHCILEASFAIQGGKEFDRVVVALIDESIKDTLFNNPDIIPLINKTKIYLFNKDNFAQVAENFAHTYVNEKKKDVLYDQLSEYIAIKHTAKIVSTIHELVKITIFNLPKLDLTKYDSEENDAYITLIDLLNTLYGNLICSYRLEERPIVKEVQEIMDEVKPLLDKEQYLKVQNPDLLRVAIALSLLSILRDLLEDTVDLLTTGDIHISISEEDLKLRDVLKKFLTEQKPTKDSKYSKKEKKLINDTQELSIMGFVNSIEPGNRVGAARTEKAKPAKTSSKADKEDSLKKKELFEIATYIDSTNKLFETIGDKNLSYEFLVCLKTSYERLKRYSEIVGCNDIVAICIEKLAEINAKLEKLSESMGDSSVEENSFKALLGFSNPSNNSYDIFISYKHEDADLANNVFRFLKSNLINPFYDKVSLPMLGKSEYHEAIMDSLDKSNHFVVILSNLEYLGSHWVELEMKTFIKELTEGRKPDANFLFIVTPEVYKKIIETNKKCIPIQYRGCEIMTTLDYRDRLLSYIKII